MNWAYVYTYSAPGGPLRQSYNGIENWRFCSIFTIQSRYKFTNHSKPFSKRQTLDSSELREFADDNFKIDKHG